MWEDFVRENTCWGENREGMEDSESSGCDLSLDRGEGEREGRMGEGSSPPGCLRKVWQMAGSPLSLRNGPALVSLSC